MFGRIFQFVGEVQAEMGKVAWPTRDELSTSTTVVLVVSCVLALFIYLVDGVLAALMNRILF